nr:ATP-binding protein [uncultured Caldimonas sp.]
MNPPPSHHGDRPVHAARLQACADEPIHIPGSIQPHGALVVLHPDDFTVLHASRNAAALLECPVVPGARLGHERAELQSLQAELRQWQATAPEMPYLRPLLIGSRAMQLGAHRTPQGLLLEFEPSAAGEVQTIDSLYPHLRRFVDSVQSESDIPALGLLAAREMRRITGFHRVLLYRFDAEWNGTVIAEDGDGTLPSYLDLRFPASDIPAQARELYRRVRLRLIPDAGYRPVPIDPPLSPIDGRALDLSQSALRSVSPVHLEYMRNMGTAASMSVSILVDGRLWGLLSCHHATPRHVGPQIRSACDFIGQILALQLGARERHADAGQRLVLKDVEAELLALVSRAKTVQDGLVQNPQVWLRLVDAEGAAVLRDEAIHTVGRTPPPDMLHSLVAWLHARDVNDVFSTHELPRVYPPAALHTDCACGLLAVPISALHSDYILWFRPEVVQTVRWGGQPDKGARQDDGRLHPRRSFALWTEQVRGTSLPWSTVQIDAARSLRNAIVNFVLRRAEEQAQLTRRLEETNRELEAFSYSVSHDLRAPFRHIVGFSQLLAEREQHLSERSRHYLDSIVESALAAGQLVDDLLHFSQLGRSALNLTRVDMAKLVAEVQRSMRFDEEGRRVEWRIAPLPPSFGDAAMLRQAWTNLIDNALKYSRSRDPAVIEIGGEAGDGETVYWVRDNGVGFDMTYANKLFGVFQRLHGPEEFKGSGIGLALTRRIIDRHGGWIAADATVGQGATFRFALPGPSKQARPEGARHAPSGREARGEQPEDISRNSDEEPA